VKNFLISVPPIILVRILPIYYPHITDAARAPPFFARLAHTNGRVYFNPLPGARFFDSLFVAAQMQGFTHKNKPLRFHKRVVNAGKRAVDSTV